MVDSQPVAFEFTTADNALLLKICASINKTHFGGHRDHREFLGAAWRGWQEAKNKFDESLGVKFVTYASRIIRGRVLDEIRQEMPYSRSTYRLLREFHALLDQGVSKTEAVHQVSDKLPLSSRFAFLAALNESDHRGYAGDEEQAYDLTEALPDTSIPNTVEVMMKAPTSKLLREAMYTQLDWRERQILERIYHERTPLKVVGRDMEISDSRVSQIAKQGLRKLRQHMTIILAT